MRVTVYCASSSAAHPEFAQAAHDLGTLLACEGATTVYGGGAIGSMGRLADGALAADGRVVGILPRFMGDLEWAHPRIGQKKMSGFILMCWVTRGMLQGVWTPGAMR